MSNDSNPINGSLLTLEHLYRKYEGDKSIPYAELLKTHEWEERRKEILFRDGFECTICGLGKTIDLGKGKFLYPKEIGQILGKFGQWSPHLDFIEVDKRVHLEVHHDKYYLNTLPWQYTDDDLRTLCNWCHWDFHQNNNVPVYSEDYIKYQDCQICNRCNGAGFFPEYSHIQSGVCFKCNGHRYTRNLLDFKFDK